MWPCYAAGAVLVEMVSTGFNQKDAQVLCKDVGRAVAYNDGLQKGATGSVCDQVSGPQPVFPERTRTQGRGEAMRARRRSRLTDDG